MLWFHILDRLARMSSSSDNSQVVNQLPISIDFAKDPNIFYSQLTNLYKKMASSTNSRELGFYFPQETATFSEFFVPNDPQKRRNVYRMVVDFGALPAAGTKSVAHDIAFDSNYRLTRLYGAATDPIGLNYIPLPYASPTLNENISLNLDSTNVNVTVGIDRSAFTDTYIVIEFTKN